jgi:hypothetical protein
MNDYPVHRLFDLLDSSVGQEKRSQLVKMTHYHTGFGELLETERPSFDYQAIFVGAGCRHRRPVVMVRSSAAF